MSNLSESFLEAYRNLEFRPLLTDEQINRFRVEYGRETIEELQQLVEDSSSENNKIIFAGHRGCGKSTLLAELSRKLESRFFVLFFSITELIDLSDVDRINIIFAIGLHLINKAEENCVVIESSIKEQFNNWFGIHTRIETKQVNAEAWTGLNLLTFLGGKFKQNRTQRNEIKQEFTRNPYKLASLMNEIAAAIKNATNKDVVMIIDDLDKLDFDPVQEIYEHSFQTLFLPNFRIIFTIPISALREIRQRTKYKTETSNRIKIMPLSKLFGKGKRGEPDSVPYPEPVAILKEAIAKRVKSELIEEEVMEQIIIYSGGVLQELISITKECCSICRKLIRRNPEDTNIKINNEVLREAITNIKLQFDVSIGTVDNDIFKKICQDYSPYDANEQRFLELVYGFYILEYWNGEYWYEVNPIVTELLQQRGVL